MKPIDAHSTAKIKAKVTREEQAARELDHTEFAPGTRLTLIVFFLVVITSVPLIQFIAAIHKPERITQLTKGLKGLMPSSNRVHTAKGIVETVNLLPTGEEIKKVEDDWEQNSEVGETILPRVQSLMLKMGQGNEKAYLGRDGWLFYRSDMDYVTGRNFLNPAVMKRRTIAKDIQPDPVKGILHFRDQLAERGITLIVVPAPVKPSIYPERFSARYDQTSPVLQNPAYEEFTNQLVKAGILLFDPAPLLAGGKSRELQYLKTDTHWTPGAMEKVAAKLAEFTRQRVVLSPAMPELFMTVEKSVTNHGDIAKMLKLPEGQTTFPPETTTIRRVADRQGWWRPGTNSEVLFLGDSFANIFSAVTMNWGKSAGFAEHLSLALGLPLDKICQNDQGSYVTRESLSEELRAGTDRLAGKKVVIWEFAARELSCGDWKLLPLKLGTRKDAGFYVPESGKTIEIEGVVRAISFKPRPRSVTYHDHILTFHLTDIKSTQDPSASGKEAVVRAWNFVDDKPMPASRYSPGDTVRLHLRPWSDVEPDYGTLNNNGLDDERFNDAKQAWAATIEQAEQDDPPPAFPVNNPAPPQANQGNAGTGASTPSTALANDTPAAAAFRTSCGNKAADGDTLALSGKEGWLFIRGELRHIGVGSFWGDTAAKVSKATLPKNADPIPAIVDFNEQLKAMGIDLIVVPVPCKAFIYPEMLDGTTAAQRLDTPHQQFFKILGEKGVKVLDLAEVFSSEKAKPNSPLLYCKTDSHWSPYACEVTAKKIKELVGSPAWLKSRAEPFKTTTETRTITGDLASEGVTEELTPVRTSAEAPGATMDKGSPIILLGDSHTLVFHKQLLGTRAGLTDQLAVEFGIPIDDLGQMGSGTTPARKSLSDRFKNPDYRANKKLIIWCFTERDFTESTSGWAILKLVR